MRESITGPIRYVDEKHQPQYCEANDCPLCKAAGGQATGHYALGRLRSRLGRALGLDHAATQQAELRTLFSRHAEAGFPALGDD